MKKINDIMWGLLLVAFGVILGLNTLDIININIFFKGWWTLFLIIPGFIGLFTESDKCGNLIVLVIGVALLLSVRDIIDFDIIWKLIFPFVIVCIGLSLIFKSQISKETKKAIKKLSKNKLEEYCAIFSTQTINYEEDDFNGVSLSSVFGSISLDLSNSKIKNDSIIKVDSIFGSCEIKVPKDVNVKVKATPIFGSCKNLSTKSDNSKVTIYVEATALFGGVSIK